MENRTLKARRRIIEREKSLMEATVKNPFVHKLKFSPLDKIQIAFMSCTIAPLRVILIGLTIILGWAVAKIALAGRSREAEKEPLTGWRRTLAQVSSFSVRASYFCGGFFWVTHKGKKSEKAPMIALTPHSSFFDSLFIVTDTWYAGLNSVVAKSGLRNVPIVGTLTRVTQPVFVSREDPNSRINTIQEIKRRATSGGKWPQIIIYPEGTCTNRKCLITFKQGAFYPGMPVQPVVLRYRNRLDTVTWTWDGPGTLAVFWYTLCQFNNSLEIEYLPVYIPNEEEKENPKLFAENVRAVSARALDVPVTDHTYEDCRLMNYAAKLDMPAAAGLLEFTKISKKLGFKFEHIKEMLEKFCLIAQKENGYITIEEFAKYLQLPVTDDLIELFELYDRDGSGHIDFREYVIGLSLVTQPAYSEETLQLAFKVFDHGGKGFITEDELRDILEAAYGIDEIDIPTLFENMDVNKKGKVSFDDFMAYAKTKPEYARLFLLRGERKDEEENEIIAIKSTRSIYGSRRSLKEHRAMSNGATHKVKFE